MKVLHIFILAAYCVLPTPSRAQLLADTLFSWQGYNNAGLCNLQLYFNAADTNRSYVVILKELAENKGPSTVDDLGFIAEQVGRSYGFDPARAYWVVHWGPFTYTGAQRSKKELFLRATFRRNASNRLGSAQWRLMSRRDLEAYTDRLFH